MESFRKVIKGWLGKVLLILFLTPLALVGIEGYFGGNSKDTAKKVNGEEISQKELDELTNSFKQQYLQYANGDETLLNQQFIQNQALDSLIARKLILQQAQKLGISLSDAQLEQMIAQQPEFQANGKFSKDLYTNYLKSQGYPNSQAFLAKLREEHAMKMFTSMFSQDALVSQLDIQQIAELQTEQRALHIASINLDAYKKAVKITPQEIADYYNKHKAAFKQMASVDVDYVVLTPANVTSANTPVTDAELQQAYAQFVASEKKNVQPKVKHILIEAGSRTDAEAHKIANDVLAKIKAGMSFAAAAAQYSDDPESKAKGGELSSYVKGAYDASFDQAISKLKAGEVSEPVKTKYGYHLIEASAPNVQVPSFESQKERLSAEVQKNKAANAFADSVNSLNDMVVGSDALDVVGQEIKGVKVQSVKGFTLGSQHPILSDANVKTKLFNADVASGDRNASSSIQLANGDTVWVKVRDYHAAGEQTLKEATPRVKEKLIEEKAIAAAKAKIQATLNAFKTESAATVVAKSGLNFVDSGTFSRAEGRLKREIERAAFSLPTPKKGMWSVTTAALPNELLVIGVSNVTKVPASTLPAEQLAQLTKLYENLRAQQELDDYTQYLKSHAKIK